MKRLTNLFIALAFVTVAQAQNVKRNIPYAEPANERQMLDVYAPENAKNLPVVFWIHGGGWQAGDKTSVQAKPKAFVDKGFVFVSTNYRLLPNVDMETIVRDVAKSIHWVHDHIAEYGGDPKRLLVMGHSAGAQLAALICTDDRYLKAEGLSLAIIKGCVPVDGDTYDVPPIIETARGPSQGPRPARSEIRPLREVRQRSGEAPRFLRRHPRRHGQRHSALPDPVRRRPSRHQRQAKRLGSVLNEAGIPAKLFGAKDTEHSKINENLGLPDDPSTKAMFEFVGEVAKK